jgi:hypothetical protein
MRTVTEQRDPEVCLASLDGPERFAECYFAYPPSLALLLCLQLPLLPGPILYTLGEKCYGALDRGGQRKKKSRRTHNIES